MENIHFESNNPTEGIEIAYERKLADAIKLNAEFNSLVKNKNDDMGGDKDTGHSRKLMEYNVLLNNDLAERVKLLREFIKRNIQKEEQELLDNGIKTKKEAKQFYDKAVEIAQSMGYECKLSLKSNIWLTLKRNKKMFELKYHMEPLRYGYALGDKGRIETLYGREQDSKDVAKISCWYDREWLEACTDLDTQRELDNIVAALG